MVDSAAGSGGSGGLGAEARRRWTGRLRRLQEETRAALGARMAGADLGRTSAVVRDDAGDTIFAIDVDAEGLLLEHAAEWAREEAFVLVAEGLEPADGRVFGADGRAEAVACVIVDPIDGTRGLMFDKRSAWSLGAVAGLPAEGRQPGLGDIDVAVMTELPTSRQGLCDVLWAERGGRTWGERVDLRDGGRRELTVRPSRAATLRHGFATVCNFFQGGKELTARLEEEIIAGALGGWNEAKAEVYVDQYISTGGQLAEIVLGRDRFVLDLRPLVHRFLGHRGTLGCRPYDLCTVLCATAAGAVVQRPDGGPLDAPLDTTTNVAFAAYANAELARSVGAVVAEVLRRHGLSGG